MKLFTFLAGVAFLTYASSAQAQESEQRDCEPIYSARIAEAAVVARARLKSETARSLANQLDSALGDNDSVNANLDARYSVVAAGGLMQNAYRSTIDSYFCYLETKWVNEPDKLNELEDAKLDIYGALQEFFDADVWQFGARDVRKEVYRDLRDLDRSHRFERGVISAILPKHNFDKVKLAEIALGADFGGMDVGGCGGILKSSIRAVDPTMLAELQEVRRMVITFLERSEKSGKIRMWNAVNAFMNDQLSTASIRSDIPLTRDKVVCVQKVAEQAAREEARAIEQFSQTGSDAIDGEDEAQDEELIRSTPVLGGNEPTAASSAQ